MMVVHLYAEIVEMMLLMLYMVKRKRNILNIKTEETMTEAYRKLFDGQGCLEAAVMIENEAELAGYERGCEEYKADAELWAKLENWIEIIYQGVSPSTYQIIGEEICRMMKK